ARPRDEGAGALSRAGNFDGAFCARSERAGEGLWQNLVPRCAPPRPGRGGGDWRARLSCPPARRRSLRLLVALWHGALADKSAASFLALQGYSQIARRRAEEALKAARFRIRHGRFLQI